LEHGEAKVFFADRELAPVVSKALATLHKRPLVIDIDDPVYDGPGELLGEMEYEAFLREGDPQFAWSFPDDEWQAIGLNYTAGTTGNPKGVVIHHRGAYINAMSNAAQSAMSGRSVYLWTLPMFHCNGWCFTWTMALLAGTNVCLRKVESKAIFAAIRD